MANVIISDLPSASTPVDTASVLEVNQTVAGQLVSRKVAIADLPAGGGGLPAGNLNDIAYISTAPSTYSATNAISVDPAGSIILRENTQIALETQTTGVDIRGTLNNDPTLAFPLNLQDARIHLYNQGGLQAGRIGFIGAITLRIDNNAYGGGVQCTGVDVGGTVRNLWSADPDAAWNGFFAGVGTMVSTAVGLNLRGATFNDPAAGVAQDQLLNLSNSLAADTAYFGFPTLQTQLDVVNLVDGGGVRLRSRDNGGTVRSVFVGDPDGPTIIYGAAEVARITTNTSPTGITVSGAETRFDGASVDVRINLLNGGGGVDMFMTQATGLAAIRQTNGSGVLEDVWIDMARNGAVGLRFNDIQEFATKSGGVTVANELEVDGDINHDGTNIGFYGTAPAAQSAAYTRNAVVVEDRTLLASASATTLNNNNVLAALIADLQAIGLLA